MTGSKVSGPWVPVSAHPDAAEHTGYAFTEVLADEKAEPTTDESVAAVARYASCSCGWVGEKHSPPDAPTGLRVRRYRRQTRSTLRPEWEAHVAVWIPDPIPTCTQSGEPATVDPQVIDTAEESDEEIVDERPIDEQMAAAWSELQNAEQVYEAARARMHGIVLEARGHEDGPLMTWAEIGKVTGHSRQAAQDRWKKKGS